MKRILLIGILSIATLACGFFMFGRTAYDSIVLGDVARVSLRHGGSGLLYSTTIPEQINDFQGIMHSTTYRRAVPNHTVGGSTMRLYDKDDKEIGTVSFQGKGIVSINGSFYKMNTDMEQKLQAFFKEFLVDKNLVREH